MSYKPKVGAQMASPNVIPMADIMLVAVTRDGTIYLKITKITKDYITGQVKDMLSARLDKTVYVKSDARAKYGDVVAVVDEIRSAGVDQLGLLTEQNQERRTPAPPANASPAPSGD